MTMRCSEPLRQTSEAVLRCEKQATCRFVWAQASRRRPSPTSLGRGSRMTSSLAVELPCIRAESLLRPSRAAARRSGAEHVPGSGGVEPSW